MQSFKIVNKNLLKLQILMRKKFKNLKNFPIGADIDGNLYFDDGYLHYA